MRLREQKRKQEYAAAALQARRASPLRAASNLRAALVSLRGKAGAEPLTPLAPLGAPAGRDAHRCRCRHRQARIRGNFTREVTDYELVEFRAAAQLQARAPTAPLRRLCTPARNHPRA